MMEIQPNIEHNRLKIQPYKCNFCAETFANEEIQMNHILNYFKTKICDYCDQIMIQIGSQWFSQHNEKHEINECETIMLPSDQQPEIEEITMLDESHFSDVGSDNHFQDLEDEFEDETEEQFSAVKKKRKNESEDNLDSKKKRLNSNITNSPEIEHFCTICKQVFNDKNLAYDHVQNYHKKPRKSISKYVEKHEMAQTMNSQSINSNSVRLKCSICEIFKPSMTSILKHFESFHKDIKNVQQYIESVKHEHPRRSLFETNKTNFADSEFSIIGQSSSKIEAHNSEPVIKHQCLICEIVKPSKSSILKHFQLFHSDVTDIETSIKCLNNNIEVSDSIAPSKSPKKSSTPKPNESSRLPIERKIKKKYLVCNLCDAPMKTIDEMMRHVKATHQIEVTMPHSEKRSQASKVFCNICKHLSNTKFENLVHMYKNHEPNKDLFKDIKWASIFKRDNNRYECLPCGKNYIVGDEYSHHLKQHHPIEFDKLDAVKLELIKICDRCGRPYLFNRKEIGKCCFQAKESAFRIMCEVCGQLVVRGKIFDDHMNTHNGIQPYECAYCSKRFSTSKDLHKHDYTHRAKEKNKNNSLTKGFIENFDGNYE